MVQDSANFATAWSQNCTEHFENRAQMAPMGCHSGSQMAPRWGQDGEQIEEKINATKKGRHATGSPCHFSRKWRQRDPNLVPNIEPKLFKSQFEKSVNALTARRSIIYPKLNENSILWSIIKTSTKGRSKSRSKNQSGRAFEPNERHAGTSIRSNIDGSTERRFFKIVSLLQLPLELSGFGVRVWSKHWAKKNQPSKSIRECILQSIFWRIWKDFGKENEAMLAPNSNLSRFCF